MLIHIFMCGIMFLGGIEMEDKGAFIIGMCLNAVLAQI